MSKYQRGWNDYKEKVYTEYEVFWAKFKRHSTLNLFIAFVLECVIYIVAGALIYIVVDFVFTNWFEVLEFFVK